MAKNSIGPHLYVLDEENVPDGPIKIGMHDGPECRTGAPGMNRGNWRTLRVLDRMPLALDDLRWSEWLIHRRLWGHHRRGEWFTIRHLVPDGDWHRFLDDVLHDRVQGLANWHLSAGGHELIRMKRVGAKADRRQFDALCSCGYAERGKPGNALPTVQIEFACNHLALPRTHPEVTLLRRQVHHNAGQSTADG